MSSSLRVVAAACVAPLLIVGTATVASAAPGVPSSTDFSIQPAYGASGQTITLTAANGNVFSGPSASETVSFNGVDSTNVQWVDQSHVTATVPSTATSGPVDLTDGTTSFSGPNFTLQQPITTTIAVSRAVVGFGRSVTVRATATAPAGLGGTQPASGMKAQLVHRVATGSAWHQVGLVRTTNSNGAVAWTDTPGLNGIYAVRFRATQAYQAAHTTFARVQVRPKLHVNGLSTAPVLTNTAITGTVAPGKPGRVLLQREISGRWRTVSSTTPRHRKFTFTISPATYQSLRYRVVYAATRAHTQATSKTLHITVVHRSLTYGDTGKDVLALQQRLRALHYDVGPASKSYGWDMVHAVTAFQKAQGDNRNGVADLQVWKQINHPKRPHLKYPVSSGYAVEVNIEKQLLLISKNGKVWRILDTSTAGGYYYTNSEGQSEQAITPRGHFSIQYKLTGWVKSKLGELYYPSYFTNTGYAIHGEGDGNDYGEVPPVPASHGCVRITNNAVLRYYYKVFTDGTSVWVY